MPYIYQADLWCDDCGRLLRTEIDGRAAQESEEATRAHMECHGRTRPNADDLMVGVAAFDRIVPVHVDDEHTYDSDQYPKGPYPEEDCDSPCHCAAGEECVNAIVLGDGSKVGDILGGLTPEGVAYVADAIASKAGRGNPAVLALWADMFSDVLSEPPPERGPVAIGYEGLGGTVTPMDGRYPAHTDIGGYPIVYITDDGEMMCAKCASGENGSEASTDPGAFHEWRIVGADIFYEGPPELCAHCGAAIESAYGDPDANEGDV